jgi:hypothetical protein
MNEKSLPQATFCLLVIAKAPIPGFAKTRLCPPATPSQASEIAACALLDTLDAVRAVPDSRTVVAMTGDLTSASRSAELEEALSTVEVIEQRGEDFGVRLANAHWDTHQLIGELPVVQIGMDTPQVTSQLLSDCANPLLEGKYDAVLGMAKDGGWWVLGLRDPRQARVLTTIRMSSSDTGESTHEALLQMGLRVRIVEELSDVDTVDDARKVAAEMTAAMTAGHFPAAVLALENSESAA